MNRSEVITREAATGEILARYETDTTEQLEYKLQRAVEAQARWSRMSVQDRSMLLRRLASALREQALPLAQLASREMGKPITEALAEVDKCAWVCEYYAEAAPAALGQQPVQTGARQSWTQLDPLGVILAVMPWNFPYWQVFRFAAPTLVTGNAALLKHSPNVTGCAVEIERLFQVAGAPEGLFAALVMAEPDVPELTTRLVRDDRVAAVSLTGSERAGAAVAAEAGRALKKSLLELGGSDPFVVCADADLDRAVTSAVSSRFLNSGQSCLAAKRFIVHRSVAGEFTDRFVAEVEGLTVGDPLEEKTRVGPLARADLAAALDEQVAASVKAGAVPRTGGERLDLPGGGWYAPTVLTGLDEAMPVMCQETFGPVAAIVTAHDDVELVRLANATSYGLGASVWGRDEAHALDLGRQIRSGALFVNAVVASDPRLPFGGVRRSGYGRELGLAGLHEFANQRAYVVGSDATVAALTE